jgi:hypothetical protein
LLLQGGILTSFKRSVVDQVLALINQHFEDILDALELQSLVSMVLLVGGVLTLVGSAAVFDVRLRNGVIVI